MYLVTKETLLPFIQLGQRGLPRIAEMDTNRILTGYHGFYNHPQQSAQYSCSPTYYQCKGGGTLIRYSLLVVK